LLRIVILSRIREGPITKLTIDHVVEIMPTARTNGLDREWQCFLKTCHDYEIAQHNVKNRLAAFLMNVARESGELYYIEKSPMAGTTSGPRTWGTRSKATVQGTRVTAISRRPDASTTARWAKPSIGNSGEMRPGWILWRGDLPSPTIITEV
jgi:hypothetical protein